MKKFYEKHRELFYNPIIVYCFLLMGVSLIAIASSMPIATIQYPGQGHFAVRQLAFFIVGIVAVIGILVVGIERIQKITWWIYGITFVPVLALFIHGHTPISVPGAITDRNGATRWFYTPAGTFQPSEFMRVAIILATATLITKHNERHTHEKRTVKSDFQLIAKIVVTIIVPALLIYRQPDTGIFLLILVTAAAMILVAGVKWRYIIIVGGLLGLVVSVFMMLVRYYPDFLINVIGLQNYQINRFDGWFDPFGTMSGNGFQLANGLIGMGSGGLTGNGFQSGTRFFPEAHTDFIFAIIGKDFGFLGSMIVIVLYGLFNWEILNTAHLNRGHFSGFMCAGIFTSLMAQQFWNIGMTVGLLPISGITLPFITHGGSSVLASMIMFGFVLSAYVEGKRIKHVKDNYKENILFLKTNAYLKPSEEKKSLS